MGFSLNEIQQIEKTSKLKFSQYECEIAQGFDLEHPP